MPARVLVVEDDPVSQDLLVSLLSARGYDVEAAGDSFGALRLIQDQNFDLVFIDYHLPEMDGYALARMMRTLGEKSGTNLNMVAITADKFGLAARRGADSIFDCILAKPIEPDTLFAFTEEFLQHVGERAISMADTSATVATLDTPTSEAADAGRMLWRSRGLDDRPTAAVFPAPTDREKASLDYCFRLTDANSADCWIVTRHEGLAEIATLRETAAAYLKPLFCLDEVLLPSADALFKAGDSDSWTMAVKTLVDTRQGASMLATRIRTAADFDQRLLAYLRVSGRPLLIRRHGDGRIALTGTGGFNAASVPAALKRLGSQGLVAVEANPTSPHEAKVVITRLGDSHLDQDAVA